ncbi:GAF domain-containing protein [Hoeflea alexandrii]|uniref:GAF domain-containing protein n=1 Tax=Hoeflea alexandrii TaxID=288436 RepID=UPI0022AEE0FB|nr:GAF domain-containing protein [Hoeflea alexandrii]MCZ4290964.1 GAF domain-containing protein [Hoeflea alexandrii]
MNQLHNLASALASPDNQPRTTFEALCAFAQQTVGAKLFTLMTFEARTRGAQRVFSNMPDAYPELGTKPLNETWWSDHVLDGHKTFVANDIDAIAEVFPDYELIASLGCQSVINVPIVINGMVSGTINCLDAAGHYTPDRVAASEALKLPGVATFLLNKSISSRSDL